jgi:membrane protease YdiL (CAAX protease family)
MNLTIMDEPEIDGDVHLLWVGLIVEGLLIAIALLLAVVGLYDHQQPLDKIHSAEIWQGLTIGGLATLPMLGYLAVFHFLPTRWLKPMREFCETRLAPLFRSSTWLELLILSLLAGFGEELLFRWCLQGGITSLLTERAGYPAAAAIGLTVGSILFGICHWVNASYGLTTLAIGIFLGLTMIWTGNFLVPAVAHALYDFVALIYIARMGTQPSD